MKTIKPKTLKKIAKNLGIETKMRRELQQFTKEILRTCEKWVVNNWSDLAVKNQKDISQALKVNMNKILKQWSKNASELSKSLPARIFGNIEKYVDTNYARQGFKSLPINKAIVEVRRAHINEAISLIKSIPQEIIQRYENTLYNNINNFDMEAIKKKTMQIGGISMRRAKLIARDQTSKALEGYAMARSQSLGFEYYVWSTSHDERVSKGKGGHKFLEGRIYRYDTPTAIIDSYGDTGHPSFRVNCRCVQLPVILEPGQKLKKVTDSTHGDFYVIINA